MSAVSERERAFLERSLADLDRELAAGDLTERDHRRLRDEYERRLRGEAPPPRPPARRGLVVLSVGFVVLVAVAAGVLVARSIGRRDAGDNITGADLGDDTAEEVATEELPADLARCRTLTPGEAIDCFTAYTDAHPDDPEGYTQFGLFAISAGIQNGSDELLSAGESFLLQALERDPADLEARVYLAVVLDRTDRPAEAATECARFADVDLPPDLQPLADLAC